MMRKVVLVLLFVLSGIVLVSLFWRNEILLSVLLVAASFAKSKVLPIRKGMLWFVVSATSGTLTESLIMSTGAWEYKQMTVVNFPLWLFFLWGYAGVLAISFYEGVIGTRK